MSNGVAVCQHPSQDGLRFELFPKRGIAFVGCAEFCRVVADYRRYTGQGAEVGDIFRQRHGAVLIHAVAKVISVVVLDNGRLTFLEFLIILLGPPVLQGAVFVKLRSAAVEAVGDLVGDDCADAAQIPFTALHWVIKRRLYNGGREIDAVVAWLITGVHRLRQLDYAFFYKRLV